MTCYRFLPFRFKRNNHSILLVNDVGDYHFLSNQTFDDLVNGNLNPSSQTTIDLQSKFFIYSDKLAQIVDLLATRYRTKKRYLYDFTSLHMFVVTQRCNQKCHYCHASSVDETNGKSFNMDSNTARKCVECAFSSPSPHMKIEFQGGEPLLNFEIVQEIVNYAKELNSRFSKSIEFVICTNLTLITDEHIDFIKENNICVSTSLDGPAAIHDHFRKTRNGRGTYEKVAQNIVWVMDQIGRDRVSALMTVTPHSLHRLDEVTDEYLRLGFESIFIRMINPYGYASEFCNNLNYSVDDFVEAYKKALKYIISINQAGHFIAEEYTTLLLTRILTPFSTGFVDLQSPSGAGINGVIYDINGDIYVADEGRMLAKMNGDKTFCIGNVHLDKWSTIFCGSKLREITKATCIESVPGCAWCVYQPYCGADPIRNYIQFGNFYGNSVKSDFCLKHKKIFDFLFEYLEEDSNKVEDVFWSWITRRQLSEVTV